MIFVSFYRLTRFALQNFVRNFWLSVVTITVIVLSLFSVSVLYGLTGLSEAVISSVAEKVDVAVYLKSDVGEGRVLLERERIQGFENVKTVEYISADDSLAFFKEQHANDPFITDALAELDSNPLGPVLLVRANDINSYDAIVADIQGDGTSDVIETVDYQDRRVLIARLNQITEKTTFAVTIVSGFFVFVSILIVFNTIKLGIYSHREEIGIMKLVGASNLYTRMPFLIQAFLYTLISCLLFWLLFFGVLKWLDPMFSGFFNEIGFSPLLYYVENFWTFGLQQFVGLVIITVFSATFAIRKYLKV